MRFEKYQLIRKSSEFIFNYNLFLFISSPLIVLLIMRHQKSTFQYFQILTVKNKYTCYTKSKISSNIKKKYFAPVTKQSLMIEVMNFSVIYENIVEKQNL